MDVKISLNRVVSACQVISYTESCVFHTSLMLYPFDGCVGKRKAEGNAEGEEHAFPMNVHPMR